MSRYRNLAEQFAKLLEIESGQTRKLNIHYTHTASLIKAALDPFLLPYDPEGDLPFNAIDPIYRSKTDYKLVLSLGPYDWLTRLPVFLEDKEEVFFITPPLSNPVIIEFMRGFDTRFIFRESHKLPSFELYLADKHGRFLFYWDEDRHLYGWGEAKTWLETHKQLTAINLFELLKKPPATVRLSGLRIENWGDKLILDGIYDPANEAIPFSLAFSGCDIQAWKTILDKKQLQNPAELVSLQDSIKLAGNNLPASIETKLFKIHFYYQSLELLGG